jgi:hypothetical protein
LAAGFRAAGFFAAVIAAAGFLLACVFFTAGFLAAAAGRVLATGVVSVTVAGVIVGATTGVSTLYGAASGCTAGANARGLGDLNQSKTAFNIKFSYELFTIKTQNWFKKLVSGH